VEVGETMQIDVFKLAKKLASRSARELIHRAMNQPEGKG
jgi:hypothetical protein